MIQVAIAGDGQLARGVAAVLSARADIALIGPVPRAQRDLALRSGADVVVIATTTRLADVLPDIRSAVAAGSNVLVSAEEAAFPVIVDSEATHEIDELARRHGVSVLGCGLNPGFVFDALVLTMLGIVATVRSIDVTRVVDLSGFGAAVAGRLGLGVDATSFHERVARGEILGHAGFPQSMSLVADALGSPLERIDTALSPVVRDGMTVGIDQEYTGWAGGRPWYRAVFRGELDLAAAGLVARDEIRIESDDQPAVVCTLDPGIGSQAGSRAVIAHSVDRVIAAEPGWRTVAELPPAHPVLSPAR